MRDYKNIRLSDDFINLTDRVVYLYEHSGGSIQSFPPHASALPDFSPSSPDSPIIHFILDQEDYAKIQASGRPLCDIAVIYNCSKGRDDIPITYLHWGQDPTIEVCYRIHAHSISSQHL